MGHVLLWTIGGIVLALLLTALGFVIWWLVEHRGGNTPPPPPPSPQQYTLTVIGGTGSGSYTAGSSVTIVAVLSSTQVFESWSGPGISITSPTASTATIIMPSSNATITALYYTTVLSPPTGVQWSIYT
jgi:hypothetical protein